MYPIKTFVFLSFILILTTCSKADLEIVENGDNRICTFSFYPTETKTSNKWSTNDKIGLSAYISGTDEVFSSYLNKQYKVYYDNFFIPVTNKDKIFFPQSGQAVDFVAYYPYKNDVVDKYFISLGDQSSQKNIDFLYSNNATNRTKASPETNLVFNHALSRIVINTSPGEGYTNKDLEGMRIIINNIHDKAMINIRNGNICNLDAKSSVIMKQTGLLSEAILLPGPIEDVSISIRLTNSDAFEAKFPTALSFNENTIYHYNLQVNRTNIVLNPVGIVDWTVENELPGTCVPIKRSYKVGDFYPTNNDPSTAIGLVYWIKPGTEGKEGKITSFDTGTCIWSETNDYQLGTSVTIGENNMMVVKGVDPTLQQFPAFKWCADKGYGWYLPAKHEIHIINEQWIENKDLINNNLLLADGEIFTDSDIYLSSSECTDYPNYHVETYHFDHKGWPEVNKQTPLRVRAVKIF